MTACRSLGIARFEVPAAGWRIWAASSASGVSRIRIEHSEVATDPAAHMVSKDGLEHGIGLLLEDYPLEVDVQDGGNLLDDFFEELGRYFQGTLREFQTPLDLSIGTEFQQRVWSELQRIPYGETISYGELARRLGQPGAARAVGNANGRNPIPVVVPCHRVIAGDGGLGGYTGGLAIKRFLLRVERDDD
jgi:O-6-methylguanine DNA methyltransferase